MSALASAFSAELRQALRDPEVTAALAAAYRPVLREELQRQEQPAQLDSKGAALLLGKVRADGSPNVDALKCFLARNTDFPRRKIGKRLVFDRAAVEAWIERRSKRKAG